MKKSIKRIMASLLVAMLIFTVIPFTGLQLRASAASFSPRTTAPDSSNSYYYGSNIFYKSGYGMPNCTCYAFGRAYEILGYEPSLCHNNAGAWYSYNINNGYYSYGSTPKLGAIACWDKYNNNNGHVAVVEQVNSNGTILISESHYSGTYFDTRTINNDSSNYLTSYRFLGYIYIGDFSYSTAKPTNVYLSINKYSFLENESIVFTPHSDNANGYTIGINKFNSSTDNYVRVYTGDIFGNFTFSCPQSGLYSAYITGWNDLGLTDSILIYFSVGLVPQNANLYILKNGYSLSENINFISYADYANGYTIGIDKWDDNNNKFSRILTQDIPSDFNYSIAQKGEYRAYITAWNDSGIIDSQHVYFSVGMCPLTSTININKDSFSNGETIAFIPNGKYADGYTIGINKYNEQTKTYSRLLTQDIFGEFDYAINTAGKYSVYVTSWNSVGIKDSDKIYFTVGVHNVSFNTNGGTCSTSSKTVTYNSTYGTLPLPTRTGYTFTGWYTSASGGKKIAEDTTCLLTADQTLYAHWTPNSNIKYVVNHYQMNANGSGYTLKETESKTGTAASSVTIANLKKTYTGFTYEGGKCATAATATKPSTLDTTTTILADGTRVINIYYSRNKYALTLSKGTGISSVTGAGTYYYGQKVSIDATLSTGYAWSKWSDGNTTKARTYIMPASATTLTANATATKYTISYTLNGGTATNKTEYYVTTDSFTLNNPTKAGYTFTGWTGTGLSAATKTVTIAKGSTGNRSYTANWTENHTHSYTSKITTPTTCTTNGIRTYSCSCGDSYTETIKATGHTDGEWVTTKSATCTETGLKTLYCAVCKQAIRTEVIPMITHGQVYSVEIDDISLNYNSSAKIKPNIKVDNDVVYSVEFESSNPKVARVDDNGKVYASGKGSATITCTVTDTNGNVVTDTCTVKVSYAWWQWLIKIVLFGWIWY